MSAPQADAKPPWQRGNPWIAGALAFLVPGAGHLYQRRYFKGAIYAVCILGSFAYGTSLADWKAVYMTIPDEDREQPRSILYLMQYGVGLPIATSYVQRQRYLAAVDEEVLDEPIDEEFRGTTWVGPDDATSVAGRVVLEPGRDEFGGHVVTGTFTGTDPEGNPVELRLGDRLRVQRDVHDVRDDLPGVIEPAIAADSQRILTINVLDESGRDVGVLAGVIPRPFWNWFQVPLTDEQEQRLHLRLGKLLEVALVYTYVAGLLNVLAVWDCIEGPAYGSDEEPEKDGSSGDEEDDAAVAKASEPQPESATTTS